MARGIWDGDAKTVQQCLTDIFTSVYTTCDIPENAIFGPCVLSHTSLYDSIAFIALKSTDKRTVPYIFRVSGAVCACVCPGCLHVPRHARAGLRAEEQLRAGCCLWRGWGGVKSLPSLPLQPPRPQSFSVFDSHRAGSCSLSTTLPAPGGTGHAVGFSWGINERQHVH